MLRCKECPFHKQSCKGLLYSNFVEGIGNKQSPIMLVFDSVGMVDLQTDNLFSSDSYKNQLNVYLKRLNLTWQDIYITTFVKCYVQDKKPTKVVKQKCFELYLKKEIETIKPKAVFLCGAMATKHFIPSMMKLKQVVGSTFKSDEYNTTFIPIYDLYYLSNFSDFAAQVKNTQKGFAAIPVLLNEAQEGPEQPKVSWSHDYSKLNELGPVVAVNVETTGLDFFKDKILTLSVSDGDKTFSFDTDQLFLDKIDPILKQRKLIFQNGLFDLSMLLQAGYNYSMQLAGDTRLMYYILHPDEANNLDILTQLHFGTNYKSKVDDATIGELAWDDRSEYCAANAYYTFYLHKKLLPDIKQICKNSYLIKLNLMRILVNDIFRKGILISKDKIAELLTFYDLQKQDKLKQFKQKFKLSEEFNLNSPKQMQKLLFTDLNLPVIRQTKTKQPSVDEATIQILAKKKPGLSTLVDYREFKGHMEKLNTYLNAIREDGRIHSEFNIFAFASARAMSKEPNIQNVPRESRLKEIFIAAPGYTFLYYDYKQIEFRVWVHLSKDKKGIEFINAGRDIHRFIAGRFYRVPEEQVTDKQRDNIKTVVYGSMYGRSAENIAQENDIKVEDAEGIQKIFFALCRDGYFWLKDIVAKVTKEKKLYTPFGYCRYFDDLELANQKQKEENLREAKNFIIQSWAVEIVFHGMYKIWKRIQEEKLDMTFVHQIHDATIIEVKDEILEQAKKLVIEQATNPVQLFVPLTVDFKCGKSWAEILEKKK